MKKELSILIPVYNDVCIECVEKLAALCESRAQRFPDFVYEIVVADDASPNKQSIEANRSINTIRNCRFIEKEQNTGSAATRNFLAKESRYQWVLFLDCDMQIMSDAFIDLYLDNDFTAIINGGIAICNGPKENLRYRYEKACEERHTAAMRQQRPYQSFRSTNFMAERELMLSSPFDERFKKSGYEDVMLGKQLKANKIPIHHIDNPTLMTEFEANGDYLKKIERSLTTLHSFRNELRGYSGIITVDENIHLSIIKSLIRLWHRLMAPLERRKLCGRNPNLKVFNLYRIGYYISLTKND